MIEYDILKTPFRYFPQADLPSAWVAVNFRYDERKLNLLWLACPEVDDQWPTAWPGNLISASIDDHYSGELSELLTLPPLEFVNCFWRLNPYALHMTADWGEDFMAVMEERAREADFRLRNGADNVRVVSFGSR